MQPLLRFAILIILFAPATAIAADTDKPLSKIAFGSCSQQNKPLPIFKSIAAGKPDLFLHLGDVVYADTEDMEKMKAAYAKLAADEGFQTLRKTCPWLAVWDDHDYGKNDAGVEYPKKVESQQIFLDFFDVAGDSPRRKRAGVYHSEVIGPVGKRVQIILLDGRYFRSPLKRGKRDVGMTYTPYIPNADPDATLLGAEQWKWLAEQLKVPAEIRLIGSGIQVIADEHGFEKWANMPLEREKLLKLIKDSKADGVILLSGDRHLAELSMLEADKVGYPLYDVTSSGFNQASKEWRAVEKNRHRVAAMPFGDNYGTIEIDWTKADPTIKMQIRDVDGELTINHRIWLSTLQAGTHLVKEAPKGKDQPMPKDGAITAKEAAEKVNQKVTLEMRVNSVGKSGTRIFLNSEASFRDKSNFAVVLMPKALTGKWEKATGETFKGKLIRVVGTVTLYKDNPEMIVDEAGQISLVDEK